MLFHGIGFMTTFIAHAKLPTEYADFTIFAFEHEGQEHIALLCKKEPLQAFTEDDEVLVRVHSECLTGDGLLSLRCDCGPQLRHAMQEIANVGQGLIVYLRQEGRGIGLTEKIKAYQLQDQGLDTFDANIQLGHQADNRRYDMLADVFQKFGIKKIHLMTNNPDKISAIEKAGVNIVKRIPLKVGKNSHNQAYLKTKIEKFKHL